MLTNKNKTEYNNSNKREVEEELSFDSTQIIFSLEQL